METLMPTYTVSYDLVKQKDYRRLEDALEKLGAHRTQLSYWLVNVTNTARELLDHLKQYVDSDDRLWISELTRNHTFANALGGTNDWLKANPPSR
jgi:CRISPR-associated endonuclease Cas2